MRQKLLIILGGAVLVWVVLALALGSPSLRLSGSSGAGDVSPPCLPATLSHSAVLSGTGVDVSPAPGTDTANPHTQVSFLGAPASEIRDVSVEGQHSGRHAGTLRGYSQGDGASFVPSTPFEAGERVSVRAEIGAGAGRQVAFSFGVDTPYPTADARPVPQPAGGAGRLPELLHDARRAGPGADRHRRPTPIPRQATS